MFIDFLLKIFYVKVWDECNSHKIRPENVLNYFETSLLLGV